MLLELKFITFTVVTKCIFNATLNEGTVAVTGLYNSKKVFHIE